MAVVLVGALNVGSMETVWAGEVAPRRPRQPAAFAYRENEVVLSRGAELGRFNMGSTVIVLFPPGAVELSDSMSPGARVRMGQVMARLLPSTPQTPIESR